MIKQFPILSRFLIFVVFPLIFVVIGLINYVSKSVPDTSLSMRLESEFGSAVVTRDAMGIVNIDAQSDESAFFAMGYVHGQDRSWQLEMQKRTAQGRLSEIFGKAYLQSDIWFRTLGLKQSAESALESLSPNARASLEAYAAGINSWIAKTPVLPPEFLILDLQPAPWTAEDSMISMKLFALMLSNGFRRDVTRLLAAQSLDANKYEHIFGYKPAEAVYSSDLAQNGQQSLAELLELQNHLEKDIGIGGQFTGSNVWAVSPVHTNTQGVLLANDPHLSLQIPALWYAVTLKGSDIDASGMSMVGLPMVILGRNQDIAWGATNMLTDNQDIFMEQLDLASQSKYRDGDRWHPLQVRNEVIAVKADFPATLRSQIKPVELEVRSTRHGPLISDVFSVFDGTFSLKWTGLLENDTSYEAFYQLNYAQNWQDFNLALRHLVSPNMNFVYGDELGNIGYLGAGSIPLRSNGEGEVPVVGWTDDYAWRDLVSPDDWPSSYNPSSGMIVNANNNPVSDAYPHFISKDWAPEGRADRIYTLLVEHLRDTDKLGVEQMKQIQTDDVSLPARNLLPHMLKLQGLSEQQQKVLSHLNSWDGQMNSESVGATIYLAWTRFLRQSIFDDEFEITWTKRNSNAFLSELRRTVPVENLQQILSNDEAHLCDDVSTPEQENCDDMLMASLKSTITHLSKIEGSDNDDWHWGKFNRAVYRHMPFSDVKLLDLLFEREIASGGSPNTVDVAESEYALSKGYTQFLGAGFRQVISLSEAPSQWIALPTGQSGNPFSSHYDDMLQSFENKQYFLLLQQAGAETTQGKTEKFSL